MTVTMEELSGSIMLLVVLILFSAYFSATETAFSSLNRIKLKHANKLMNNKYQKISLQNVAKLCGFSTYSTFYREYVKFFGFSPKDVQKINIEKWKSLN